MRTSKSKTENNSPPDLCHREPANGPPGSRESKVRRLCQSALPLSVAAHQEDFIYQAAYACATRYLVVDSRGIDSEWRRSKPLEHTRLRSGSSQSSFTIRTAAGAEPQGHRLKM